MGDEMEEEINPFSAMPGLDDCPLAGLRSALSRPASANTTSERLIALGARLEVDKQSSL